MNTPIRVTLLGFTVPDSMLQEILEKDQNLPLQTHKFAWSLARALRDGGAAVELLSALPVSNYPVMPKLWFGGRFFCHDGFRGRTLGFVNAVVLKHVTRTVACLLPGWREIVRHRAQFIVVHGVHSPFLWFSLLLRRKDRKVVVVVTDPPGVVLARDGILVRFLKKLDRTIVKSALSRVDGVVALTQALIDDYSPMVRGIVLPGFMDRHLEQSNMPSLSEKPVFDIAYAGGLFEQYGVGRLLDAVLNVRGVNVRLTIYGKGDLESRIKEVATSNPRVRYGGVVAPKDLVALLQSSDLLVNPRPSDQDFVRHSFPSKLIEYLALGVPVLTTRLPGIPDSYLEQMYLIDDESAEGLRKSIEGVAALPLRDRVLRAKSAREFVFHAASESVHGASLVRFLRSLN
ncbi:glycosyltransferase [Zoogloea sp.]|uniref:glycosyltransferase n=1 Tax=Zoogloea sp. TaxID=49181 RepID=UPI0035B465E8